MRQTQWNINYGQLRDHRMENHLIYIFIDDFAKTPPYILFRILVHGYIAKFMRNCFEFKRKQAFV
jgi:hypothetical protein